MGELKDSRGKPRGQQGQGWPLRLPLLSSYLARIVPSLHPLSILCMTASPLSLSCCAPASNWYCSADPLTASPDRSPSTTSSPSPVPVYLLYTVEHESNSGAMGDDDILDRKLGVGGRALPALQPHSLICNPSPTPNPTADRDSSPRTNMPQTYPSPDPDCNPNTTPSCFDFRANIKGRCSL